MAEFSRKNRCLKCTRHAGFDVYKTDLSHRFNCPKADCDCLEFCQQTIQQSHRVRKAQIAATKFPTQNVYHANANVSIASEHKTVDEFKYDANVEFGEVIYYFSYLKQLE